MQKTSKNESATQALIATSSRQVDRRQVDRRQVVNAINFIKICEEHKRQLRPSEIREWRSWFTRRILSLIWREIVYRALRPFALARTNSMDWMDAKRARARAFLWKKNQFLGGEKRKGETGADRRHCQLPPMSGVANRYIRYAYADYRRSIEAANYDADFESVVTSLIRLVSILFKKVRNGRRSRPAKTSRSWWTRRRLSVGIWLPELTD